MSAPNALQVAKFVQVLVSIYALAVKTSLLEV